ncbi:MAG: prepilin-type N-terminal cleavage/methylation domain-containing protein [Candidatus Omnitrophota bacterium]
MKRGFTLIELIIVIIIIGVLATLAVPQYLKSTERAKGAKARHALGIIAQAEKMYRAENDTYINVAADAADATLGAYTELAEMDNDVDWQYVVSGSGTAAFLITATRSDGNNATETITIDQAGVWGGTFTP